MNDAVLPDPARAPPPSTETRPVLTPLARPGRHNVAALPRPLTALIGREREVREISVLLQQPEIRLITVTGPGGVGKTRLALHVAAELASDFPDGVCFVSLAGMVSADQAPLAIAERMAIRVDGEQPTLLRLCQELRDRRCLLVLDGFEQVVAAASVLTELLVTCPRLVALVTSRILLRVAGEREYTVPPFSLPPQPAATPFADLAANSAVRLFGERVQAVRPDFALTPTTAPVVAEICRRVDGLPLAIELAAAHGKVLAPAALLARLSSRLDMLNRGGWDRPPGRRTLRDVVASSEQLLSPAESALFRRLSVFAGGFPAEAVAFLLNEQAALPTSSEMEGLDELESLVDHSLLRVVDQGNKIGPRFAMLDTIREYAAERLVASGEETTMRRRHAAYCLAIAERTETPAVGPGPNTWLQRLDVEIANVRAALAWAAAADEHELVLRLAGSLWFFWYSRGHLREGCRWLKDGLAGAETSGVSVSLAARATALGSLGMLACLQTDHAFGVACLEECLALRRTLDDRHGIMRALILLGGAAELRGDEVEVEARMEQALTFASEVDDPDWVATALERQGTRALSRGAYAKAGQLAAEAVQMGRMGGKPATIATLLVSFARIALARGDDAAALAALAEALVLAEQSSFVTGVLDTVAGYAGLALALGQAEQAVRLLGAVDAQRATIGLPRLVRADWFEQIQVATRSVLAAADFAAAWAAGQALPLDQAVAEARRVVAPASTPASAAAVPQLTARERDVLRLLATGSSNREIADTLFISLSTVKGHIQRIFAKLDVDSRTAAALYAREHGID